MPKSKNDLDSLQAMHTASAITQRVQESSRHDYLGDFVLGSMDGTITTFSIIASAAGAGLSGNVAVILGLANMLADGLSMAAGNYLKAKTEQDKVERYRRIEEMHIERIPDAERAEVREIFLQKGFEGEALDHIVQVITADKKRWIDTMLTEEWGLQLTPPKALTAALITFGAFVVSGFIPVFPMFFYLHESASEAFPLAAAITGFAFFLIGYGKGMVEKDKRRALSGLKTFLVGVVAAGVAFAIGRFLQEM